MQTCMKETFCKKISGTFVGSMFPAHYMESKKVTHKYPFPALLQKVCFPVHAGNMLLTH